MGGSFYSASGLHYLCKKKCRIWPKYKFDEDSVKALINWAKSTSFPQSVTLSDAENIVDVKRFVQANLSDIDAHYPDDFYNPAITRLYRLKEYMEENK